MIRNLLQRSPRIFCLLITILVLQPKYCELRMELSTNFYKNTTENLIRSLDFDLWSKFVSLSLSGSDAYAVRKARGFQMYANKDDLKVDIEFVVPFVRIPIERSLDVTKSALRNLANLKAGPLLWSGVLVAFGASTAALLKVFSITPLINSKSYVKTKRSSDVEVFNFLQALDFVILKKSERSNDSSKTHGSNGIIQSINSILRGHNINIESCLQRSVCQYARKVAHGVRMGEATGLEKILDGLISLEWLHEHMRGTAIHRAIERGNNSFSCEMIFPTCKWAQSKNYFMDHLYNFIKFFISLD